MRRMRLNRGFTLLDLLVTLAIVSILTAVAAPPMGDLVESIRSKAVRKQLQSLMGQARSHALFESQVVTICHLDEDGSCLDDLLFPLSIFTDPDRNASMGAGETLLHTLHIGLPEDFELLWNRNNYLRYWPSGGTGALTGSLSYCHQFDDRHEFRIVLARTGRTRVDYEETRCE